MSTTSGGSMNTARSQYRLEDMEIKNALGKIKFHFFCGTEIETSPGKLLQRRCQ